MMKDLVRLRRQHEELSQKMTEVEQLSLELPNAVVAGKCARMLAKLQGLMQVHLIMEEAFFYARVERFENPALRAICRRFKDEIDLFTPSFKEFIDAYGSGAAIDKQPQRFQGAMAGHFDWLRRRMAREERELYGCFEKAMAKKAPLTLLVEQASEA